MSAPVSAPTLGSNSVSAQLDRLPVGRLHRRIVWAVGLGLFFDIYEIFLSSSISVALSKDFTVSPAQLSLLLASAFLGMFVGSALLGRLADRIGRRKAFIFNLIWYSGWSLIAAFSPSAWFLVVARFMAGVGVGAEYPVADSYLSDVMPKDKRGRMASYAYTASFVAVPIVGLLAYFLNANQILGVSGWRWLLGLGAIGAVAVLWMRRSLPESPRWLAAQGRYDDAQAGLEAFAAGSGVAIAPIDRTATASLTPAKTLGLGALIRTKPYGKRFLMMVFFHLLQTFGYYGFGTLAGLVLVARGYDVTTTLLYVAIAYFGYPIGALIATPLFKVIERKHLIVFSLIALAASGIVFATATNAVVIILFGFLTTAISNIFSNAYHVYQAEIFPTSVRASAVGATYALSRLSTGALPFILLPILDGAGALWMFLVVALALLIVCVVVQTMGPKTTRMSVEEINSTPIG